MMHVENIIKKLSKGQPVFGNVKSVFSYCQKCSSLWFHGTEDHCAKCHTIHLKNSEHCCACKLSYHTIPESIHCKKCHSTYSKDSKHCCKCNVSYNELKQSHCCGCKIIYNMKKKVHCSSCHLTYPLFDGNNHCCECKVSYNSKSENHCCECKYGWDNKYDSHCCQCRISYCSETECHCCSCQIIWDKKAEIHCEKCCSVYISHKNIKHCCEHANPVTWNTNISNYCTTCEIIYDKRKTHCCQCSMIIDVNILHCDTCHTTHNKDFMHCCKTKQIWDPNKNAKCDACNIITVIDSDLYHCCFCQDTYDSAHFHCPCCHTSYLKNKEELHCCGCGETFNPEMINHCNSCCFKSDKNSEIKHCCKCQEQLTADKNGNPICRCDVARIIIEEKVKQFLSSKSITEYIISPCLENKCNSIKKFEKCILSLGFENICKFLNSDDNWLLLYHGTDTQNKVKSICCEGWDVTRRGRNGQSYGEGEYFSDGINTGKNYSRTEGSIILSLVVSYPLNKCMITHDFSGLEMYYIVNNPPDMLYSLPVAIIKHVKDISKHCCPKNIFTQTINMVYWMDSEMPISYDDNIMQQILGFIKKKTFEFVITTQNGEKYKINLINNSQTNVRTGYVRDIVVQH